MKLLITRVALCSTAAHLLQSHSEQAHYALFLLDYVGVAVYQYGCALALSLYSSDSAWTQSMLGQVCECVLHPSSLMMMCSAVLMMSCVAGLPPGRRPPRLVLLHRLLLCEAPVPAAVPAPQEALPGAADGRGLPAGHQPCCPPSPHLQLVKQLRPAPSLPAGGASYSLSLH